MRCAPALQQQTAMKWNLIRFNVFHLAFCAFMLNAECWSQTQFEINSLFLVSIFAKVSSNAVCEFHLAKPRILALQRWSFLSSCIDHLYTHFNVVHIFYARLECGVCERAPGEKWTEAKSVVCGCELDVQSIGCAYKRHKHSHSHIIHSVDSNGCSERRLIARENCDEM